LLDIDHTLEHRARVERGVGVGRDSNVRVAAFAGRIQIRGVGDEHAGVDGREFRLIDAFVNVVGLNVVLVSGAADAAGDGDVGVGIGHGNIAADDFSADGHGRAAVVVQSQDAALVGVGLVEQSRFADGRHR